MWDSVDWTAILRASNERRRQAVERFARVDALTVRYAEDCPDAFIEHAIRAAELEDEFIYGAPGSQTPKGSLSNGRE